MPIKVRCADLAANLLVLISIALEIISSSPQVASFLAKACFEMIGKEVAWMWISPHHPTCPVVYHRKLFLSVSATRGP